MEVILQNGGKKVKFCQNILLNLNFMLTGICYVLQNHYEFGHHSIMEKLVESGLSCNSYNMIVDKSKLLFNILFPFKYKGTVLKL